MQQQQPSPQEKKAYTTPRLVTHGDVAKLTQSIWPPTIPGSTIVVR